MSEAVEGVVLIDSDALFYPSKFRQDILSAHLHEIAPKDEYQNQKQPEDKFSDEIATLLKALNDLNEPNNEN